MRRDEMIADIERVGVTIEPVQPMTLRQVVILVAIGAAAAVCHLLVVSAAALLG